MTKIKTYLEKKVAQLTRLGWTKSPTTESLISPGGERRVLLLDLATENGYPWTHTSAAEQEEWREWMLREG